MPLFRGINCRTLVVAGKMLGAFTENLGSVRRDLRPRHSKSTTTVGYPNRITLFLIV